jgi:hypothetical protein
MDENKVVPEYAPVLIGKRGLSPHDDVAAREWPTLMQLLLPRFDDKRRLTREAGVISIRVDGPLFRVSVVCPTEGVQAVLGTTSLMQLMEQLELFVGDPLTSWVPTYESKKRTGQSLRSVLGY